MTEWKAYINLNKSKMSQKNKQQKRMWGSLISL